MKYVQNRKIKMKSKIPKTDPQFCSFLISNPMVWFINQHMSTLTISDTFCIHKNLDVTVGGIQIEKAERTDILHPVFLSWSRETSC